MAERLDADFGSPAYRRDSEGSLEFDRVAAFSDGVFAIALTLLVITIDAPDLPKSSTASELTSALWGQRGQVLSFVIAFALVGRYWFAHHYFFASLAAVTPGLIGLNLVFLGLVCFIPYPTDVLGNFGAVAPAVVLFAACMVAVSAFESLLYVYAYGKRLLAEPPAPALYRATVLVSFVPATIFLVSIPVALWSPPIASYTWLATFLVGPLDDRVKKRAVARSGAQPPMPAGNDEAPPESL